jgi:hypothetical protein
VNEEVEIESIEYVNSKNVTNEKNKKKKALSDTRV